MTQYYCGLLSCPRGENAPRNRVFLYPPHKPLKNKRWDTHNIGDYGCPNLHLCENQTSHIGIQQYECLGHKEPNPHRERIR
tara:strand:+ start:189 stop:431 length:243 start_codon:yes stop_codon:yes gene_type:complete